MITSKQILHTVDGIPYIKQIIIPEIPLSENDFYIITNRGDRLDLMAYNYWNNGEYWRIINAANGNIVKGSLFPKPGTRLRIPADIDSIITLIEKHNKL